MKRGVRAADQEEVSDAEASICFENFGIERERPFDSNF